MRQDELLHDDMIKSICCFRMLIDMLGIKFILITPRRVIKHHHWFFLLVVINDLSVQQTDWSVCLNRLI